MTEEDFIAHRGQSLREHLVAVGALCGSHAAKIGLELYGLIIGILHDLGKYSAAFQHYILSSLGEIEPEDEDYVDGKENRGKIDHSTAGAQFIWENIAVTDAGNKLDPEKFFLRQILALCIVSHHSGLIDCLSAPSSGSCVDNFTQRIKKDDQKTHCSEALQNADQELLADIKEKLGAADIGDPLHQHMKNIISRLPAGKKKKDELLFCIQIGFLTRFLLSCLLDADRTDSADSENPQNKAVRQNSRYISWQRLVERMEEKIASFGTPLTAINQLRRDVSLQCAEAAQKDQGLFTLTVPTGGGKTLAGLRFALLHAQKHNLDRIFYIAPFTSILDQNAQVAREILEHGKAEAGKIILEHHSNLEPENTSWQYRLLCENWDTPIVFTTMVQFLETFFSAHTRSARRMHQLARSVIIFDEIQTLPIRCAHLFCNAVQFLTEICHATVVLCTATQPLLNKINPALGCLKFEAHNEIVQNVPELFSKLKRVQYIDKRRTEKWTVPETAEFAVDEAKKNGSCLVVVNTKKSAWDLYMQIRKTTAIKCILLSTALCPRHRKKLLAELIEKLKEENADEPIICVSTSLIEAGIDIDFATVIRYVAGLDSISQAGGRGNRHGKRKCSFVYIINPADEHTEFLPDIEKGKATTKKVFDDYVQNPHLYGNDLVGLEMLDWYYKNYFFARADEMAYRISVKEHGRDDTLLSLLSNNAAAASSCKTEDNDVKYRHYLRQSFKTAGELFKSLEAPNRSVIVPYEEGKKIIGELCAAFDLSANRQSADADSSKKKTAETVALLKAAQQYAVNMYESDFKKLDAQNAVHKIQESGLFFLDASFYSDEFGLVFEPLADKKPETLFA